jgi:hypothetical protein
MRQIAGGVTAIMLGLIWAVGHAVFVSKEGQGHTFYCGLSLDLRCQWAVMPGSARILIFAGTVLLAYGLAATAIRHGNRKSN